MARVFGSAYSGFNIFLPFRLCVCFFGLNAEPVEFKHIVDDIFVAWYQTVLKQMELKYDTQMIFAGDTFVRTYRKKAKERATLKANVRLMRFIDIENRYIAYISIDVLILKYTCISCTT